MNISSLPAALFRLFPWAAHVSIYKWFVGDQGSRFAIPGSPYETEKHQPTSRVNLSTHTSSTMQPINMCFMTVNIKLHH